MSESEAEEIRLKTEEDEELQRKIKSAQGSTSYIPQENERHLFHVKLDKPLHDSKTGKKLSKEFIQKFTKVSWDNFTKAQGALGYDVQILWNPINFK